MRMSPAAIKPFYFEDLESLSREQVQLQEGVLRYLPQALPAEVFLARVQEELKKFMRERVHFEQTALREPRFEKYCSSVPDPTLIFVFSCEPLQHKAFLQVDFALAHILVDRMLGGSGEYPQELRPLTSIEEGVLQFLVLKILNLLAEAIEGSEVQFRLEKTVNDPLTLRDLGEPEDLLALLSIQVTVGKKAGFVRLALPHPLVEGLVSMLAPYERVLGPLDVQRLERMVEVKVPLWIELGHLDLKSEDFSRLEHGDVVLLDKVFVEIGDQGLEGPVTVRVHEGVGGGFRGKVVRSQEEIIGVEILEAF